MPNKGTASTNSLLLNFEGLNFGDKTTRNSF